MSEQEHQENETKGCLRIPIVTEGKALCLLIVNCIIAGLGTMIAACSQKDDDKTDTSVLLCGLLQFLTGFLLVGYIWSIVWGVRIYTNSKPKVQEVHEEAAPLADNTTTATA